MIFVVLGTHELPFRRLLVEIDRQIELGNISEEVIVQAGHTSYQSPNMQIVDFITYEEMARYYEQANFIITHGGTGSITMGVKMGKKVIAVPRVKEYREHNDNHQFEIVDQFYQLGYILCWHEDLDFASVLNNIKTFTPKRFVSGKNKIISMIQEYIETI